MCLEEIRNAKLHRGEAAISHFHLILHILLYVRLLFSKQVLFLCQKVVKNKNHFIVLQIF